MKRRIVLGAVLALFLSVVVLAACVAPAFAVTPHIEHLKAQGTSIIDVSGQTKILIQGQYWEKGDFYAGSADRIAFYVSTGDSARPFKQVASYEDNPTRMAFSQDVDQGGINQFHLVKRDQIQIFIVCKTVFVYWTVPLVALATTTTPAVTLPPGCLVLRGYGDFKSIVRESSYPSGWSYRFETSGYDAKATLFCPGWHYWGAVGEQPIPPFSNSVVTEGLMTWTHQ